VSSGGLKNLLERYPAPPGAVEWGPAASGGLGRGSRAHPAAVFRRDRPHGPPGERQSERRGTRPVPRAGAAGSPPPRGPAAGPGPVRRSRAARRPPVRGRAAGVRAGRPSRCTQRLPEGSAAPSTRRPRRYTAVRFSPRHAPPRGGVGGVPEHPCGRPAPAGYARRGRLAARTAAAGRREGGGGGSRRHIFLRRALRRHTAPRPPSLGRGHDAGRNTGGGGWLVSTEAAGRRRAVRRPPPCPQPTGESPNRSYAR